MERGTPAIRDFFTGLIEAHCSGPYAGFGCLVTNAHTGPEAADPAVRQVLALHERLRQAMAAALRTAQARRRMRPDLDPAATAETLALPAYGINLRSRADPAWPPDGKWIAYTSHDAAQRPDPPALDYTTAEIYVRAADGTGTPTRLTSNAEEERAPAWSHHGDRIAYMCRSGLPASRFAR